MNTENNTQLLLEQQVIGTLLLANKDEQIEKIESMNINLFEHEYHKMIFKIMKELIKINEEINLINIIEKINSPKKEDINEDIKILTSYSTVSVSSNQLDSIIKLLNRNAECRNAKNILQNALLKISEDNYLDIIENVTKKIEKFEDDATKDIENQSSKMLNAYMDILDDIYNQKSYPKWSIKILDDLSNGIRPGETTVIAGASGLGKTAIITQIMLGLIKQDQKVIFFNLEMNLKAIIKRILSQVFGVSIEELENSKNLDLDPMYNFFHAICNTGNFLIYDDIRTVEDIRRIIRKEKPNFVAIDYLQLCGTNEKEFFNREQEVAYISREFKEMSKKFNCHIVQLSQVNAEALDHRPKGEKGLRESKAIYHSVDNCIYLWEPSETYFKNEYMNKTFVDSGGSEAILNSYEEYERWKHTKGRKLVEIIMDKQRQGRQGRAVSIFIGAITKYTNTTFDNKVIKKNEEVKILKNTNKKPSFK